MRVEAIPRTLGLLMEGGDTDQSLKPPRKRMRRGPKGTVFNGGIPRRASLGKITEA